MLGSMTINIPQEAIVAAIGIVAIGIGIKFRKYVFKTAQTFLGLGVMAAVALIVTTTISNMRTDSTLPGEWGTLFKQVQSADANDQFLVIKVFADEKGGQQPPLLKRGMEKILSCFKSAEQKEQAEIVLAKFTPKTEELPK